MGTKLLLAGVGVYALCIAGVYKLSCLHRNWRERFKERFPYPMTVIAHRGGSLIGPENTIYMFNKGLAECNVDMLELDVWESKDGQIVVSHDRLLGRTCGEKYNSTDLTELTVGSNPSATLPQSARTIPLCFQTETLKEYVADAGIPVNDTTRLCLLTEVFEKFQATPMHIDIKMTGYDVVKKVMDMLETYKRESITFVGSSVSANRVHIQRYFQSSTMEKRSHYRIFGDVSDYFNTVILYYLGLLPFVKINFDVFSIPIHTHTLYKDANIIYGKFLTFIGTSFLTSPGLWQYLQYRGVAVVGWVMNDEIDYAEVISYPVNGIMTDDPKHLSDFLAKHSDRVRMNILA